MNRTQASDRTDQVLAVTGTVAIVGSISLWGFPASYVVVGFYLVAYIGLAFARRVRTLEERTKHL